MKGPKRIMVVIKATKLELLTMYNDIYSSVYRNKYLNEGDFRKRMTEGGIENLTSWRSDDFPNSRPNCRDKNSKDVVA